MKSFILAAGQGTRLRPLTDEKPKCMVSYKGKAIIDYIIDSMRSCGIEDINIVKGYRADQLHRPGTTSYINEEFASTNMVYTLFCAEKALTGDVVISYGDIIFRDEVLLKLINSPYPISVTVDRNWRELWEKRMEDPLKDAETMKINKEGLITELGKSPKSYEDVQAQYMGLIKISGSALPAVIDFYHSLDKSRCYDSKDFNNMYMTSFLQLIIDRLMPIKAVEVEGGWLEVDSPDDLSIEF